MYRLLFLSMLLIVQVLLAETDQAKQFLPKDWIIGKYKAITKVIDGEKTLEMNNGLISRTFLKTPNGATIRFNNLMDNGDSVIRSSNPEGFITLNGVRIQIGGVENFPIRNYTAKRWLKNLVTPASAFKYKSHEVRNIQARFKWKKQEAWISSPTHWPPKGKELIMSYDMDETGLVALKRQNPSNRKKIFKDLFNKNVLSKAWEVVSSHKENKFENEGKAGEIRAVSDSEIYITKKASDKARVFVAQIKTGTDGSRFYGLGMELLIDNKETILMAWGKKADHDRGRHIVIYHNNQSTDDSYAEIPYHSIYFRFSLGDKSVICSTSINGKTLD